MQWVIFYNELNGLGIYYNTAKMKLKTSSNNLKYDPCIRIKILMQWVIFYNELNGLGIYYRRLENKYCGHDLGLLYGRTVVVWW